MSQEHGEGAAADETTGESPRCLCVSLNSSFTRPQVCRNASLRGRSFYSSQFPGCANTLCSCQRLNLSLENQSVPAKLLLLSHEDLPLPHKTPAQQQCETLFQWQIQQELRRMVAVPTEVLNTADGDGDT